MWFSQAGGQQWTAVDRFLAESTALLCSLIRTNADVVSPVLFATLASNIGFNIYFTALLVYGRAPPFVSSLFLGAVLCNTVLALAPLVALFSAFHRVDYLCRLQMNISSNFRSRRESTVSTGTGKTELVNTSSLSVPLLKTKIKLMTYYEVLHTDDQFAFTVGPLGKVTASAIFQVNLSFFKLTVFNYLFKHLVHPHLRRLLYDCVAVDFKCLIKQFLFVAKQQFLFEQQITNVFIFVGFIKFLYKNGNNKK